MLEEKNSKQGFIKTVILKKGDAENLEFDSNSFDIISIGYGVRNFENLEKGLKESFRVLAPNGKLIILKLLFLQILYLIYFQYLY